MQKTELMSKENNAITRYIESYAYVSNLGRSITLLNNWARAYGFEFIEVDIVTFQNKFGQLINYKIGRKPVTVVQLSNGSIIDKEFYQLLFQSQFYRRKLINEPFFIFVKHIEPYEQQVINNTVQLNTTVAAKMQNFLSNLIRKLRLFKAGSISIVTEFEIERDSRHIGMMSYGLRSQLSSEVVYEISPYELPYLIQLLDHEIKLESLNEIALLNFEASYSITNIKVRFITLVTSLESIFNHGRDQIAHTISRHMSILISKSQNDFEENYKRIKKLYNKRNTLVHGGHEEVSSSEIYELEDLVRKAIVFTLYNSYKTRQELFDYCNSRGF